jgi:hypothetical protein
MITRTGEKLYVGTSYLAKLCPCLTTLKTFENWTVKFSNGHFLDTYVSGFGMARLA